ncbi:MAG: hypothetical protein AAGA56_19855 [Myxococcota bacterium]
MEPSLQSLAGIADVAWLGRKDAPPSRTLLVEVPHGADELAHFAHLAAQMEGPLPASLEVFFFANTDRGAYAYGRRTAELLLEQGTVDRALIVRCLIPRTLVDANRLIDSEDHLAEGGLTGAIPAYIEHPGDRRRLRDLHRRYVELADRAYDAVCGGGGLALCPHTYGPRSMGIARVDAHIVAALRDAYAPGTWESWPLRPEVDLITSDTEGRYLADRALAARVLKAFADLGWPAIDGGTYKLHPQTTGARYCERYPGRVLCLEIRRDLLVVKFDLLSAVELDVNAVERAARALASAYRAD